MRLYNTLSRRLISISDFKINRYGNWGVCFIYGAFFALGGLAAANKTYENSATVRRGVEFLLRTQGIDGGWAESYLSCPKKVKLSIILEF